MVEDQSKFDKLTSQALQENILALLCYDESASPMIRGMVDIELFDSSHYREIANRAVNYLDEYKKPPGQHLADVFEDILTGRNKTKSSAFSRTLQYLDELYGSSINADYVVSELGKFIRHQRMNIALKEAVFASQEGDLDRAEVVLSKCLKGTVDTFQTGTYFSDHRSVLTFLEEENTGFDIRIPVLDKDGVQPARKELFTILAPPNKGKTWFMIHVGKAAIMQNLKVLHITLEMSEPKIAQRYYQAFFAASKRSQTVKKAKFVKSEDGLVEEIEIETIKSKHSFDEADIKVKAAKNIKKFRKSKNLVIKQFPTGALTIKALETYLESLERHQKFIPDMIIVDYADLMWLDSSQLRIDTGRVYKELRGIAVDRNVSVVTASQSNRGGAEAQIVDMTHLAEDFSKAAISDNIVTYNQTADEKERGLARLFVAKGRNDRSGQLVNITQCYTLGQFCLESCWHIDDTEYWDMVTDLPSN